MEQTKVKCKNRQTIFGNNNKQYVRLSNDRFKNNEEVSKYSCKSNFSLGMHCSINSSILTLSLLLKLLSFCGFRALFLLLLQIKFPQWFVSFKRQKMCVGGDEMCACVCLRTVLFVTACMFGTFVHT